MDLLHSVRFSKIPMRNSSMNKISRRQDNKMDRKSEEDFSRLSTLMVIMTTQNFLGRLLIDYFLVLDEIESD